MIDVVINIFDQSGPREYPFCSSFQSHEYMVVGVGWVVGSDQSSQRFLMILLRMNDAVADAIVMMHHDCFAVNGDYLAMSFAVDGVDATSDSRIVEQMKVVDVLEVVHHNLLDDCYYHPMDDVGVLSMEVDTELRDGDSGCE